MLEPAVEIVPRDGHEGAGADRPDAGRAGLVVDNGHFTDDGAGAAFAQNLRFSAIFDVNFDLSVLDQEGGVAGVALGHDEATGGENLAFGADIEGHGVKPML